MPRSAKPACGHPSSRHTCSAYRASRSDRPTSTGVDRRAGARPGARSRTRAPIDVAIARQIGSRIGGQQQVHARVVRPRRGSHPPRGSARRSRRRRAHRIGSAVDGFERRARSPGRSWRSRTERAHGRRRPPRANPARARRRSPLQPALRVGHRPRLRELDREEAERVTRHDAIELARLLRLAHGEERLDPALCADGLDPDVVAAIDERQAERRAVGAPGPQLIPDPLGAHRRRPTGARDRQPVQVEQQDPPLRDVGERIARSPRCRRPPSPHG